MNDTPGSTAAETLVPPRPNLGPEPWPEASRWPVAAGWGGVGVALVLLVLLATWRRRRRTGRAVESTNLLAASIDPDSPPRQRLIASSAIVRGALIGAFGPGWGSKTTEEIGDDLALLDRIGPDEGGRLVAFLRLADRAKFASPEPESPEEWEAWAALFVEGLAAGVTSRSNGK
jgi:hypothetical protein